MLVEVIPTANIWVPQDQAQVVRLGSRHLSLFSLLISPFVVQGLKPLWAWMLTKHFRISYCGFSERKLKSLNVTVLYLGDFSLLWRTSTSCKIKSTHLESFAYVIISAFYYHLKIPPADWICQVISTLILYCLASAAILSLKCFQLVNADSRGMLYFQVDLIRRNLWKKIRSYSL